MSLKTSISGIFAKDTPVMIMESGIAAFPKYCTKLTAGADGYSDNANTAVAVAKVLMGKRD